jgi:hypothetical protein
LPAKVLVKESRGMKPFLAEIRDAI